VRIGTCAGSEADTAERIGRLAVRALLREVAAGPKPGLVDRFGSGSHDDMDFMTFSDSALALGPSFAACAREGLERGRSDPGWPAAATAAERGSAARTDEVLSRIKAMALGMAQELGKRIRVELRNEIGVLPRLSELRNPLLHMVRNALDHGLEEGIERLSAGKEEEGRLSIRLYSPSPGEIAVEVEDDGRGIDFEAVRQKAVQRGLLADGEAADSDRLARIIFRPGFSSRDAVTGTSGRGVGLDAVAEAVKTVGGRISVWTKKNAGARFTIRFPAREA